MATSKSRCLKKQRSRWASYNAEPANHERRTEAMREAKQAIPRDYPAYLPGSEWVTITLRGPGINHTLELRIPPEKGRQRPRSDQAVVLEDGQPWPELGTRTAVARRVQSLILRRFSRDELAGMS